MIYIYKYIFHVPYQRIYAEGMNLEHIVNKLPRALPGEVPCHPKNNNKLLRVL